MRTVAVVLAGGAGSRFGPGPPKQLQLLRGRSLLDRCVGAFDQAPGVDEVLAVVPAQLVGDVRRGLARYPKLADVIDGGAVRTDSTQRAIAWLTARVASASQDEDCQVLFHDAARPLVDQRIVADCVAALERWDAIGVVVPSADTIVEITGGAFGRILPRDALACCQTPQGFRLSVIRSAYELAAADPEFAARPATDDCGVVLRYLPGVPVGVVRGSERNIKITYASDLAVAETLLGPEQSAS